MQPIAEYCSADPFVSAFAPRVLHKVRPSYRRDRAWSRDREDEARERAYRLGVVSLQVRRVRFARFVDRALRDAQARGMSTAQIEAATRVGSTTYYRWRKGDWAQDPQTAHVKSFCVGLGLDPDEAYRALDWQTDNRPAAEPLPLQNPKLIELAQLLSTAAPEDRAMIEEMIRVWVARLRMNRAATAAPIPIPMPSDEYDRRRRGRR